MKSFIRLLLFLLALALGALFLMQVWTTRQIERGMRELQAAAEVDYFAGHARLLALSRFHHDRVLALVGDLAARSKPGPDDANRSVHGDQMFWRCIILLGDIGDPESLPRLETWLREDDMNSFAACMEAMIGVRERHPHDPGVRRALPVIAEAVVASKHEPNRISGMEFLGDHGGGAEAAIILTRRPDFATEDELAAFYQCLEAIARRGDVFDVGALKSSGDWTAQLRAARMELWMGKAEALAIAAEALRGRAAIPDDRVIYLAADAFDTFTERNLQFRRSDDREIQDEKIVKYLKLADAAATMADIYRKPE